MTTMGFRPSSMALLSTNLVWALALQRHPPITVRHLPILKPFLPHHQNQSGRSVDDIDFHAIKLHLQHFLRMVIPLSLSRSLLSRISSPESFRSSKALHSWIFYLPVLFFHDLRVL